MTITKGINFKKNVIEGGMKDHGNSRILGFATLANLIQNDLKIIQCSKLLLLSLSIVDDQRRWLPISKTAKKGDVRKEGGCKLIYL